MRSWQTSNKGSTHFGTSVHLTWQLTAMLCCIALFCVLSSVFRVVPSGFIVV